MRICPMTRRLWPFPSQIIAEREHWCIFKKLIAEFLCNIYLDIYAQWICIWIDLLPIVQTYDTKSTSYWAITEKFEYFRDNFLSFIFSISEEVWKKTNIEENCWAIFLNQIYLWLQPQHSFIFFLLKWWFRFEIRRQKRVLFSLHRPHSSNHLKN